MTQQPGAPDPGQETHPSSLIPHPSPAGTALDALRPDRPVVLTIGVFDGVHLGHQELIGTTVRRAHERGAVSAVVTFHPHPALVLRPEIAPRYLTSSAERIALIKNLGVDLVIPLQFTRELAQRRAREFIDLLRSHLNLKHMVVGYDFAFGRGREGDIAFLRSAGQELGFTVESVGPLHVGEMAVSSTAIREAIAAGDMTRARQLLGRPYFISGPVIRGDQRGRLLGFPTANIDVPKERQLPAEGVYAGELLFDGAWHDSVCNIGLRPTFDVEKKLVEAHVFDWQGDLYGQHVILSLVQRLRGQQKFSGLDELKAAISRDAAQAREILAREKAP